MHFYMGNGEGSIRVCNGAYEFVAEPSGSGGDVRSIIRVSCDYFSQALSSALDLAEARELRFAREPQEVHTDVKPSKH